MGRLSERSLRKTGSRWEQLRSLCVPSSKVRPQWDAAGKDDSTCSCSQSKILSCLPANALVCRLFAFSPRKFDFHPSFQHTRASTSPC